MWQASGGTGLRLPTHDCAYSPRRVSGVEFVAVTQPRPKESSQPVSPRARYNMDVRVSDRLTDDVVHRDEGSLCSERFGERPAEPLC